MNKKIEEMILSKIKVGLRKVIPECTMLNTLKLDTHVETAIDSMIIDLTAYMFGNKTSESEWNEYNITYEPIDGWNMLKSEKKWLRRIFGEPQLVEVQRIKKVHKSVYNICPHVNVPWKTNSDIHIQFLNGDKE